MKPASALAAVPARARCVTHKDVAQRAGVSVATVSYVINGGPRPVSKHTRARVQAVIDELQYYPNALARGLRLQQSATIGVLLPGITNAFYAEIAQEIESVCFQQGFSVLLCTGEGQPERERRSVQALRAKQVEGLVVVPGAEPRELLRPIVQARIPLVVLEHDLSGVPCIAIEEWRGGMLATQHLTRLGHTRIALLRAPPTSALSSRRLDGYREALQQAGLAYDPELVIECAADQASGYRVMSELLARRNPPGAVFAHNDLLAMGAIHAAQQAGLSVPHDISVVGYDDIAGAAYLHPPLTTVRFPKAEMGRRAAAMVLALIRGQADEAASVTLPVELVVRASTAPPREAGAQRRSRSAPRSR